MKFFLSSFFDLKFYCLAVFVSVRILSNSFIIIQLVALPGFFFCNLKLELKSFDKCHRSVVDILKINRTDQED